MDSNTIRYTLHSSGFVNLTIYNIMGQRIIMLANEMRPAGSHTVVWYGRDSHGNDVASGIYIARLEIPGKVKVRKLLLMR